VANVSGIRAELLHAQEDGEGILLSGPTFLDQTLSVVARQQQNREAANGVGNGGQVGDDVPAEGGPHRLHAEGISGALDFGAGVFEG